MRQSVILQRNKRAFGKMWSGNSVCSKPGLRSLIPFSIMVGRSDVGIMNVCIIVHDVIIKSERDVNMVFND